MCEHALCQADDAGHRQAKADQDADRRDSTTGVQRLVDAHDTDLVLMGIRMPRMDGLAATAALRRRADPPEVLILTTFTSDGYILDALRAGAPETYSNTPRRSRSSPPCARSWPVSPFCRQRQSYS
ncbi:hypothetical protein SHL15_0218 [Streptomyces hygroscopicus subsp. limoneus]|nr:hypothetical protein SHL15_0218 [Streptomyces hygroscopicus subsp. limoneus]